MVVMASVFVAGANEWCQDQQGLAEEQADLAVEEKQREQRSRRGSAISKPRECRW